MIDAGVLIMAGGEATRLPDKLVLDAGDVPMIVRVYRNVSPGRPTYVSCKTTFPSAIDTLLPCPMVVDEWARRGPLAGMVTTMSVMPTRFVFAVAGDAPLIDTAFIDALVAQHLDGDEAVVPARTEGGRRTIEPLAALYDRAAFIAAGFEVLRAGEGALRLVLDRINTRYVDVTDTRIFMNVNTPSDYQRYRQEYSAGYTS